MNFIYLSKRKVYQLTLLSGFNKNKTNQFETIGNDYGFMIVPRNHINSDSVILSFGVGEDIEAEIDLIGKYNCAVHLYDPTDLSVKYMAGVKQKLNNEGKSNIADKLLFTAAALWKNVGTVRFFKPKDESFVSHSINNIEATDNFVEVPSETIKSIMRKINVNKVDYIKMDIEGAEYEVLDNMFEDNINFSSIYLEFHYDNNISILKNILKIRQSLKKLAERGFEVIYCSRFRYFCLVKRN